MRRLGQRLKILNLEKCVPTVRADEWRPVHFGKWGLFVGLNLPELGAEFSGRECCWSGKVEELFNLVFVFASVVTIIVILLRGKLKSPCGWGS